MEKIVFKHQQSNSGNIWYCSSIGLNIIFYKKEQQQQNQELTGCSMENETNNQLAESSYGVQKFLIRWDSSGNQ